MGSSRYESQRRRRLGSCNYRRTDQEALADLDVYSNYVEDMRLVWSKNSKRVAHFEPDRRGGTTYIYFRDGSKFEEVEFPSEEVPECHGDLTAEEKKEFVKTTEPTQSPKQWLKSGTLVVVIDESWLTEGEDVVPRL